MLAPRPTAEPSIPAGIDRYLGLFREINDLKRLTHAGLRESWASRLFRVAWDEALGPAARPPGRLVARAIAATRLGAIDEHVLAPAGVGAASARAILARGIAQHECVADRAWAPGEPLPPVPDGAAGATSPWWVDALARQPRAGATAPGRAKLVLEPPESHAEHCIVVALYGFLLAPHFGADGDEVWLAGLAHHLANAVLPDAGFTGEVLLGELLDDVLGTLRAGVLDALPAPLAARVGRLLALIARNDTAVANAFHAADALDRVLQMQHYERSANFALGHAVRDMELIHAGPVQDFQHRLLDSVGLLPHG